LIRILGIGNPLFGDDGVGISVIAQLWRVELPEAVEAIDAGTGGLDLLHLMADAEQVVLVDAVEMGLAPGAMRWVPVQQVKRDGPPPQLSLHETRVGPLLQWLDALGCKVKVQILGIQPASVRPATGLSPLVEAAVPAAVTEIRRWLKGNCGLQNADCGLNSGNSQFSNKQPQR
jgi:hydrogenase maturation protease